MRRCPFLVIALAAALSGGCEPGGAPIAPASTPTPSPAVGYTWRLPAGFPTPGVPADNPMSEAKVQLGRRLFYDKRLSGNQTQACASCHQQARAFTDGRATALGSTGESHVRGALGLANVAYAASLTWASPLETSLELQMLVPLEGSAPVELGMGGREDELLSRLSADAGYMVDFQAAFPDESAPVALTNVMKAIASFERTLISGDAPVDRARRGEPEAMSASARRGEALFQSERLGCASCHGGLGYSSAFFLPPGASVLDGFRHNGLKAAYPANNAGLAALNPLPENNGRFRVPSLRNVALTAPYMHDGSLPTLEAVVAHYARGGAGHPYQDPRVKGFTLTETEAADMVAFLHALTDETFVQDPRFAAPPAR